MRLPLPPGTIPQSISHCIIVLIRWSVSIRRKPRLSRPLCKLGAPTKGCAISAKGLEFSVLRGDIMHKRRISLRIQTRRLADQLCGHPTGGRASTELHDETTARITHYRRHARTRCVPSYEDTLSNKLISFLDRNRPTAKLYCVIIHLGRSAHRFLKGREEYRKTAALPPNGLRAVPNLR